MHGSVEEVPRWSTTTPSKYEYKVLYLATAGTKSVDESPKRVLKLSSNSILKRHSGWETAVDDLSYCATSQTRVGFEFWVDMPAKKAEFNYL